ncbi:MAG TPA: nitroreductase family protein [Thermodesulfobacteriota bacterium]|nr:nitroreductase family protein [Thermodesulfobacteriota bacterium]
MPRIEIDGAKCVKCGDCVAACSPRILTMKEHAAEATEEKYCNLCGHCAAVCPTDAIRLEGMGTKEYPEVPADFSLSPETLFTFLRSRRSCKVFASKDVPKQALESLIEAARYSPTGSNSQNVQFTVIRDRALVRTLAARVGVCFGNLYKMLSAPGAEVPEWVQRHLRGMRLNWEDHQAGKDRIFRDAPSLIVVHAPSANASSAQNCHLAMAHILLQAHAIGLGACVIGYFLTAVERDPSIIKELEIPAGNKIFTCCTVGYPALKFRRLVYRKPPSVRWF